MSDAWFVYILKSGTVQKFYTGITKSLKLRLRRHNGDLAGGAKFTRVGRPWQIGYVEGPMSCQDAMRRERQVKKLSHLVKAAMCSSGSPSALP